MLRITTYLVGISRYNNELMPIYSLQKEYWILNYTASITGLVKLAIYIHQIQTNIQLKIVADILEALGNKKMSQRLPSCCHEDQGILGAYLALG
jgi:hypothetical protein